MLMKCVLILEVYLACIKLHVTLNALNDTMVSTQLPEINENVDAMRTLNKDVR